ncbi:hypothetical protein [Amycolatopsis sp. cmx-11-12]|uniref:hypothetical protein n=1 Tax=Amycolatopsis sp. cmx-11-12 TaxID=2785795 RepID=UPI0039170C11
MATLLTQPVHGLVGIEYKHFTIQSRGLTEPPRFPFDRPHDLILPLRDALAIFVKSDPTTYAFVHLEVWDSEPATTAPPHSDTETQTVVFTVPEVTAQGAMATAPDTGTLRLAAPGPYRVRVHRWGAEDVNQVFDANPNALIHLSERFIVQLWPTEEPSTEQHPRTTRTQPRPAAAHRDKALGGYQQLQRTLKGPALSVTVRLACDSGSLLVLDMPGSRDRILEYVM